MAVADARDWLDALGAAWRAERIAARAKVAIERTGRTLPERVALGIALDHLRIVEERAAPGGRVSPAVRAAPTHRAAKGPFGWEVSRAAPVKAYPVSSKEVKPWPRLKPRLSRGAVCFQVRRQQQPEPRQERYETDAHAHALDDVVAELSCSSTPERYPGRALIGARLGSR